MLTQGIVSGTFLIRGLGANLPEKGEKAICPEGNNGGKSTGKGGRAGKQKAAFPQKRETQFSGGEKSW